VVGLVGLSVLLPGLASSPLVSRGFLAMVCAVAGMLLGPTGSAARAGRAAKLTSGPPARRAAALGAYKARGFSEFLAADLSDADLGNMNLAFLVFDRGRFVGTRFHKTRLEETSFVGADLTRADFSGADLRGINIGSATGWDSAKCDAATRPPREWRCVKGAFVSVRAIGAEPDETDAAATAEPARP
jgi:hypothetical protein